MSYEEIIAKHGGKTKSQSGISGAINKATSSIASAAKSAITGQKSSESNYESIINKYKNDSGMSWDDYGETYGTTDSGKGFAVGKAIKNAFAGKIRDNEQIGAWYEGSSNLLTDAYNYWQTTTAPMSRADELEKLLQEAKKLSDYSGGTDGKGGTGTSVMSAGQNSQKYTGEQKAFLKKNGYKSLEELEKAIESARGKSEYDRDYGSDYTDKLKEAYDAGVSALAYMKAHKSEYKNYDAVYAQTEAYVQNLKDMRQAMLGVRDYYQQWDNADEFYNGLGFWDTVGETAKAGWNTMVADFVSAAATMKGQTQTDLSMGQSAMAAGDGKTYEQALKEVNASRQKSADETAEKAQKYYDTASVSETLAKWKKGDLGQLLVSAGIQVPAVAADTVVSIAGSAIDMPWIGLVPLAVRAYGGGAEQARAAGLDWQAQELAGFKSAAIEVASEKMFSAFGKLAYGKGYADDIIGNAIDNAASNKFVKMALHTAAAFGEEGIEEVMSDILNPALDYAFGLRDQNGKLLDEVSMEQILEDFLVGGILGLAGTGGQVIMNKTSEAFVKNPKLKKIYGEFTADLIEEAMATPEGSESKTLAAKYQKKLDAGKELSGAEISKLIKANGDAVGEENSALDEDSKEALTLIGAPFNIKPLAAAMAKDAAGLQLSAEERDLVQRFAQTKSKPETTAAAEEESLDLGAMTYDEQEDFLRERYADAMKSGILNESFIQTMTNQLRSGAPLEDMVRSADGYVSSEEGFRTQEQELRDRYAEEIESGIVDDGAISAMMEMIRGGTAPAEAIAQMDEMIQDAKEYAARKEAKNGEKSLRGSMGRQSNVGTGEQGRGISEGTAEGEGTQRRADTGREEAGRNDSKKPQREKVSGKELKIPGATENKTLTIVKPKGVEARIVKAFMPAAKSITLVKGDIEQETENGIVKVSGLETPDGRIWARMDHKLYSGTKLLLHECGHLYTRDDAELRRKMHNAAAEVLSENGVELLANRYSTVWRGLYKLPDGVESYDDLGDYFENNPEAYEEFRDTYEQEIFCDALAGLDRAKAPGASKLTDAIRAVFLEETGIDIEGILNGTVEGDTAITEAQGTAAEVEERETGPPKYSYGGENAETADIKTLSEAKQLEENGEDSETIRHQTGWFKGMDGKWRFEIDDSEAEIRIDGSLSRNPDIRRYKELLDKAYLYDTATKEELDELRSLDKALKGVPLTPRYVGDMLKHDSLYEAYPSIADIEVAFVEESGIADAGINPTGDRIFINNSVRRDKVKLKKSLLHELQHAIQIIEGHAGGASVSYWKGKIDAIPDEIEWTVRQMSEIENRISSDLDARYENGEMTEEEYEKEYYSRRDSNPAFKRLQKRAFELRNEKTQYEGKTPGELYKNTAGEIEARDTANRSELTAEERKNTRPDIDRADVVFSDGGMSNSVESLPDGKKYVRADRQVIFGNDPEVWSEQLEAYINNKIRKGENVHLITEDGDVLTITEDTAGKVSSRYKDGRTMSDEAFERKVSAGTHIDELAQISVRGKKTVADAGNRHGAMASAGWNYRTAYFLDFDGKYYRCTISVSVSKNGNAVYNIGEMEERSFPTAQKALSGSSANSGALGREASSQDSILNPFEDVNSYSADELDDEYNEALFNNDMERAQELVDEAAKAAGYTERLYHGTPNGTFNVFRDWTYFTEDKSYADVYQSQGASVNVKKTADNPRTYGVFAKIENAFDTRKAREKKIFQNEFYLKWGNGAPLSERGLPDWTDGDDLIEFFEDNGYEYDAILLDEGGTGGYGEEVKDRGISYVIKNSAQVKSADPVTYDDNGNVIPLSERFKADNADIRYSADDTMTAEEVQRRKTVKSRANAMGMQKLRERVASIDGQITGLERVEDRTEQMERELEQLKTDREIFNAALENKTAKAQQAKTDRQKAKEAAERAVDELSIRQTTAQSRKALKKQIFDIYGIKHGFTEVGDSVDAFTEAWISQGKIGYKAIEKLENMLMDQGEIRADSIDEHAREVRNRLNGGHISVPRSVANEFADDWDAFRKRAFANGIYLSIDTHYSSIDQWTQDLATSFGKGRFDETLDEKEQLENIVDIAEQGRSENLTVWQMADYIAKTEGETASDLYIEDVHEQLMRSLKSFAQSAKIEMETVKRSAFKEVRRQAALKERMERAQREKEQREFQQKTLKQLQWLKRNQNIMGNDFQEEARRILEDIDTIAISAANEMNWSEKYQATWEDLAKMYKWAEKNDPNFLPSKELENIVMRVEGKHLDELSASDLEEIYKAAVALRTAYYNRNNVINDELHRQFAEVFEDSVADMKAAPKPKNKTGKGRNYLDSQLNPIHRIERMFGWKENSPGFQIFGRGLEKGERLTKRYVEQANQMLDDWMTENEEWVRNSDGQGKDATWYELEVPELLEFRMGDKPLFGDSVKVYMTPMQKVYMYLESKNYDNLRHMAGGRTFADKELYSQGEYTEAFAQGTTVSLAPETVKKIVSDLTPKEMELAELLDKYFNGYAKEEINRVSNILYGYDRAMSDNYAPIYTNSNYNKSEPGIYQDGTAEGVGHMKTRAQGAKNPTYNISAMQAFQKHVSQTSRFVGMAIPAQNAKTLLNWSAHGVTMQDHITHEWSQKELDSLTNVMTELQAPTYMEQSEFAGALGKIMSNYIGGVFGANLTVSAKVLASKPTAAIVLGNDTYPSIAQQRAVDEELVRKYTSELDVRIRGLGRPELAALTLDEGKYQRWVQSHKLTQLTLGGGLLQAADVYVAKTMWAWAENRVRADFPDLEIGTQEQVDAGMSPFYKKVAEVYENAIGDTQSMYDIMHRSDIMRDTNEITRSFTIFHTDSLQAANLLRKRAGELQAAKASGNETTVNTAVKKLAVAAGNVILMNALVVMFDIIRDLFRRRDDKYKDDEGELTFWSMTSEALLQLMESSAGMLIGLDAILPAIESAITGDSYFEHQVIAVDAFNDILKAGKKALAVGSDFVSGFADAIKNGGDVWQYLTEAADFRGMLKDTAEDILHYFSGIPIENVERLFTNLLGWVWPEMSAAYDGIWESRNKADLKQSTSVSADIMQLYSGRGDINGDMADELARLYEAGYTDAVMSDTPSSFTVNGEETELTEAYKQRYNAEIAKNLDGELSGLMSSPEYQAATDEQKTKMLSKLYAYATARAKAEINPEYDLPNWVEAIPELRDAGIEWGSITEALVKQSELNKTTMTAGEKATQFAIWIDNKGYTNAQENAIKDAVKFFSMVPAEAKRYEDLTAAGISVAKAEEINDVLNELTPQAGSTQVSALQKVSAVAYMTISEADKEKAMKVIYSNSEKAYNRYMIARKNGVLSADYADFLEELDRIDVNGGNPSRDDFTEAVARSGFNTDAAKEIWYTYWKSTSPWG